MPMIRICSAPGCRTRTLGEFCIEHELPANTGSVRVPGGRPPIRPPAKAQLPVALDAAGAMPRR